MSGTAPRNPLRVAVTRPPQRADDLADLLRAGGAVCITIPLTSIAPPDDSAPLEASLQRLGEFDWIVFTSANAVESVRRFLRADTAAEPRVAAVGDATAAAVRDMLGWSVAAVPAAFTGAEVVPAMERIAPLSRASVLWPRAEGAREELATALRMAGASVTDPVAYRTRPEFSNARRLHGLIAEGAVDVLTFTAPSAVESYVAAGRPADGVLHAVIGSTTAEAARAAGLEVNIQPAAHTLAALADAILAHRPRG